MAAVREPRKNAGNRMSKVLEEELEEDDFYKTTYGGFMEEEEDNDFDSDQEDSADEVDSDFDQSEHDELISDDNDADKPKRRKKGLGVSTKAYKEPGVKKAMKRKDTDTGVKTDKSNDIEERRTSKSEAALDGPSRKSSRRATATNSLMTSIRRKEREETDKKKKAGKKIPIGVRRLTQEELLAEAEKTEKKNLKSLENYQRLEASRKKTISKKRVFEGPTIKYLSTIMPSFASSNMVDVEKVDSPSTNSETMTKSTRNFLVFSHDSTFQEMFSHRRIRPKPRLLCLVTKKPAKYVDPLTKIPYHDATAYKQIRETYSQVLNEKGDKLEVK